MLQNTRSLLTILIPFALVILIETFGYYIFYKIGLIDSIPFKNVFSYLLWLISGTSGPGSYYVPILIQLTFLFPLLILLFKKNKYVGLVISFGLNLIYEILVYSLDFNSGLYRLLIFRYIFILGLGIYLAYEIDKNKDYVAIILLVIGFVLITINHYFYHFPLFQSWKSASMICGPFVYGVLYFILKYFKVEKNTVFNRCGEATYHIYLTQMVYYLFANSFLLWLLKLLNFSNQLWINVIFNLIVCFFMGYLFFLIDGKAKKWLFLKLKLVE